MGVVPEHVALTSEACSWHLAVLLFAVSGVLFALTLAVQVAIWRRRGK